MNYMNDEGTIATIVESMLPRFSSRNLGLNMILEISAHDFGGDRHKDVRKYLHLLFVRPSNFTKVFTRILDGDRPGPLSHYLGKEIEMKLRCDHDSCWRSDGLREIFELINKCCHEVKPNKPFADSDPQVSFYLFSGAPRYVEIYKVDKSPHNVEFFHLTDNEKYGKVPIKLNIKKDLTIKEAAELMRGKDS